MANPAQKGDLSDRPETVTAPATKRQEPLIQNSGLLIIGIAFIAASFGLHRKVLYSSKRIQSHFRHKREMLSRERPDRTLTSSQEDTIHYDAILEVKKRGTTQHLEYTIPGEASNVYAGNVNSITIPPAVSSIAQGPGRKLIALLLSSVDGILIISDDPPSPGLAKTAMLVEIDIDPVNMSGWDKSIEAWTSGRGSRVGHVTAQLAGGFFVGVACSGLFPSNDFRSGCTNTQVMFLVQQTADELWFRKPGFWGVWTDVDNIDTSMWAAFGGRKVRFIWRFD